MRSKTSFFNKTIFVKNMGRFWPVWGSYLLIWIIIMPVVLFSNMRYGVDAVHVQEILLEYAIYGGVIMGAVYGLFAAMGVWSFLYNARSAHGFACLPVRREGLYLSNMLAGVVPLLASNVAVALLTLLVCGQGTHVLIWLAVTSLILLFFYGFATLCAQLTGSIVILPLVYIALNFVVIAVEELLRLVFAQFVYGMSDSGEMISTRFFSPVVGYLTSLQVSRIYDPGELAQNIFMTVGFTFVGWGVVLIYAAVGLVMLGGALLLFRARRMETAGDVVAVKPLKPVFRWVMGLCGGLVFASLVYTLLFINYGADHTTAFLTLLVFLFVGSFLGWFIAEMLIKKSFRVFSSRTWAGWGLCCIVILAMMLGMRFDLFGYEKRVPNADSIASVVVYSNGETALLEGAEGVEQALELHRQIIADKRWNEQFSTSSYYSSDQDSVSCRFTYALKNGGMVVRRYELGYEIDRETREPTALHDVAALNALMNSTEAIENRKTTAFPFTADNITYAFVETFMSATELAALEGYESAEDYILAAYSGWGPEDYREYLMTPQERQDALTDAILYSSVNGYALEKYRYEDIDLSEVYFSYSVPLTQEEAWELYSACVLPDIADGTLGRVWVVADAEYENTVYDARITIEAREANPGEMNGSDHAAGIRREPGGAQYYFADFYTVPTVDSTRTNVWLAEHGITMRTYAELGLYAWAG